MSDYAFEGPRWATSTITWSFAPSGDQFTNAITGAYQDIVRAGLARWAQVGSLSFQQIADGPAVDIRIGWAEVAGPKIGPETSPEIGQTDFTYLDDTSHALIFDPGALVKLEDPALIPVRPTLAALYQGTAATLYQTVLHELGHALGLAHGTNPTDVMFPTLGPSNVDLGADDIQGIQRLYAGPPGTAVTAASASPAPATTNHATAMIPVYRFFDTVHGTELLTASTTERAALDATRPDLIDEGIAMGAVAATDPAAVPVFRFFDPVDGTHFLTIDAAEKRSLADTRPDLVPELSSFYEHATAQAGDVAVYRFFETANGTHFYTVDAAERAAIAATRPDMIPEGIAFYSPDPA